MKRLKKIIIRVYHLLLYFCFGGVKYAQKIGVKVGSNCRIYTNRFGSEPFLITIGDKVTITSGVTFLTHDGSGWLFNDDEGRRYYYSPIEIGNSVFIGVNSIILPGVKIESNVIIAAGSVITKSIPKNSIVAGVPAKVIGQTSNFEKKVLNEWISHIRIDNTLTYKEKIKKITHYSFKPFLKNEH